MFIGICYNWKGLKEENYLYTLDEIAEVDFDLLSKCVSNPEEWHDSTLSDCPWKTWMGKLLKTEKDVVNFLSGYYNDTDYMDKDSERYQPDWYWANQINNDLYGKKSDTMKKMLLKFQITQNIQ